ncbi:MAG: pyridoxamine 5'-phosphate oxidase family protein [Hyphomicrobiaceae bacterium]|nr:pyridoxamine 5'-phosphate oxidase family protein [Hyphomicrobiaceae bacterium]
MRGEDKRMDASKHLYEMIKDFRTAMLVTRGAGGTQHARPMAVAELRPDAEAWFVTSLDSPKIAELEKDPGALITFQSATEFATVEGTLSIVRDQAEIDRLWSDTWKLWFPKGKQDPSLCLLKFVAERGEYWDNSGFEGIRYVFEGMKSRMEGRRPRVDEGQHAKVNL